MHRLVGVLQLAVGAILCGARSLSAITQWGKERLQDRPHILRWLGLRAGCSPSVPTVHRVLSGLPVGELERAIGSWVVRTWVRGGETLAIDGKTLRGTCHGTGGWVHLVSVVAVYAQAVVIQRGCDGRGQELATARELVGETPVAGNLVMADALLTQRDVCEVIIRRGGDYFLRAKGNQAELLSDIERAFGELGVMETPADREWTPTAAMQRQLERRGARLTYVLDASPKGCHGRLERRELWALADPALNAYLGSAGEVGKPWPHVRQVCYFRRQREVKGQTQIERGCALTSLGTERAEADRLLAEQRGYWGAIENRAHWVRDVTLGEDASQVRTGAGPQAMAALRNVALALLRHTGVENIAAALRTHAANPEAAARLVLFGSCDRE